MITVRVYNKALEFIDLVPSRSEPAFTEALNDTGTGTFKVGAFAPEVIRSPTLLAHGNYVLMHDLESNHYFCWRIEGKKKVLVGQNERADIGWEISGRGVACLMQAGIVLPETGITRVAQDTRPFNFATKASYWYNPADWHAPLGRLWKTDSTSRRHYPKGWPDPDAHWIWNTDPAADADPGNTFFRATLTLGAAGRVAIFATADNSYTLYVDAQPVMSGRSWRQKQRFDIDLAAGAHVIAIKGTNAPLAGTNPAGVLCSIFAVDPTTEKTETLLLNTNVTDWKCHHTATPYVASDPTTWPPGWDVGDIMDQLFLEARARGVQPIQRITGLWSPSHDSAGNVWARPVERAFSIGADYLEVADQLAETSMDYRIVPSINPDSTLKIGLKLYNHLGVDRTIGSNNTSGVEVAYIPALNVDETEIQSDASAVRTFLVIKTDNGWITDTASTIATEERWESYLSAGQGNDPHAISAAEAAFAAAAQPQQSLTIKGHSVTHHKPFIDFDIGDDILGPGEDDKLAKFRVLAITLSEDADGKVQWSPELGFIKKAREKRHSKLIKHQSSGVAGAGSMGGILSAPMPVIPMASDVVAAGLGPGIGDNGHQVPFSYHGSSLVASVSPPYVPMFDERLVEVLLLVNAADGTDPLVVNVRINGSVTDTITLAAGATSISTDLNHYLNADTDRLTMELVSAGVGFADLDVLARFS